MDPKRVLRMFLAGEDYDTQQSVCASISAALNTDNPYFLMTAKVKKGGVRNMVLREIKALEEAIEKLTQGEKIKHQEISEYKEDKQKTHVLKKQVEILENGVGHIKEAVKELRKYKDHKTN